MSPNTLLTIIAQKIGCVRTGGAGLRRRAKAGSGRDLPTLPVIAGAFTVVLTFGSGTVLASPGGPGPDVTVPVDGVNPGYQVAASAQAFGAADLANIFGGVTLSENASHVNVYLTEPDPSTETQIEQASGAQAGEISFYQTPATQAALDGLNKRVAQDVVSGVMSGLGVQLAFNYPDVAAGKEVIGAVAPSAVAASALFSKYGPLASVVDVPASQAIERVDDRQNDTNPFNGGDFISDDSTGTCTSGFPVHGAGYYYLLTAAHCFTISTSIYNFNWNYPYGNNTFMGNITSRDSSYGGYDAEVLGTGSSNLLYTGTFGHTQRDAVSGLGSNIVGEQICTDGAFDGTDCGPVVQQVNMCGYITQDGGLRYVCGEVSATSSGSTVASGPGDSGGPVYLFSGSSLLGLGTITAANGASASCIYFIPRSGCTTGVIYTDLGDELGLFNMTLNT